MNSKESIVVENDGHAGKLLLLSLISQAIHESQHNNKDKKEMNFAAFKDMPLAQI